MNPARERERESSSEADRFPLAHFRGHPGSCCVRTTGEPRTPAAAVATGPTGAATRAGPVAAAAAVPTRRYRFLLASSSATTTPFPCGGPGRSFPGARHLRGARSAPRTTQHPPLEIYLRRRLSVLGCSCGPLRFSFSARNLSSQLSSFLGGSRGPLRFSCASRNLSSQRSSFLGGARGPLRFACAARNLSSVTIVLLGRLARPSKVRVRGSKFICAAIVLLGRLARPSKVLVRGSIFFLRDDGPSWCETARILAFSHWCHNASAKCEISRF